MMEVVKDDTIQTLVETVKALQESVGGSRKNPTETTLVQLRRYCESRNLDKAQALVNRFDILPVDVGEGKILEKVCKKGYLDVVQWLVDTFDLNFHDGDMNWDCLLQAYRNGHSEVVEYLVDRFGLDRDFCMADEWKVLMYCNNGDYKQRKENPEDSDTSDEPDDDCLTWVCRTFLPESGSDMSMENYCTLDSRFSRFNNTIMVEQFLFRYGFNLEFIKKHDLSSVFKQYYESRQEKKPSEGECDITTGSNNCFIGYSSGCDNIAIGNNCIT